MKELNDNGIIAHGEDYFENSDIPITARRVLPRRTTLVSHAHDLTEINHQHDFCELVIVLQGMASHCLEGNHFPVASGDVFVLQGHQQHYFYDRNNFELMNVMYDPERLNLPDSLLRRMPGYCALFLLEPTFRNQHRFASRLHLDPIRLAKVEQLAEEISQEAQQQEPGYAVALTSRLLDLMVYLSRNYLLTEATEAQALVRLGNVLGQLESDFSRDWSINDLLKTAHMSRSHFMRTFKKATHLSPIEYLNRLRIRKAMELLRGSSQTISEIASQVGFNDSNYFTRQFGQHAKIPPAMYRKRNREQKMVSAI